MAILLCIKDMPRKEDFLHLHIVLHSGDCLSCRCTLMVFLNFLLLKNMAASGLPLCIEAIQNDNKSDTHNEIDLDTDTFVAYAFTRTYHRSAHLLTVFASLCTILHLCSNRADSQSFTSYVLCAVLKQRFCCHGL